LNNYLKVAKIYKSFLFIKIMGTRAASLGAMVALAATVATTPVSAQSFAFPHVVHELESFNLRPNADLHKASCVLYTTIIAHNAPYSTTNRLEVQARVDSTAYFLPSALVGSHGNGLLTVPDSVVGQRVLSISDARKTSTSETVRLMYDGAHHPFTSEVQLSARSLDRLARWKASEEDQALHAQLFSSFGAKGTGDSYEPPCHLLFDMSNRGLIQRRYVEVTFLPPRGNN